MSAAVGMGVVLILLQYGSGVADPAFRSVLAWWTTVPYIAAGLAAWLRRPESRLGVLMVIAGFASSIHFLFWSSSDVLHTVGLAGQMLPPVMFLHVYMAFPTGRLESRLDRGVVALAYASMGLVVPILFLGAESPRNVLAIIDNPALGNQLVGVQLIVVSATLIAGLAVLVRRRVVRGRPLRASLGYIVDSFGLALVMMALLLTAGFFEWSGSVEVVRTATFAAVGVAPVVFLAGLLQVHLAKTSVSGLLVELDANPSPGELSDAVARALKDPSARLAFWLPEFGAHADANGHQIDVDAIPGRSLTPIERDGELVATLVHDSALDEEPELVSSVAAAAGIAMHNAKLQVELRARLEELRGSRARILEAEQRERRRLERDLHDGAQQRLVALTLELGNLERRIADDPELSDRLATAKAEVSASLTELRNLAQGIHPAVVSDHGLGVALESLATRAAIPVEVVGADIDRLPEAVEMAVFYLVSEALTNIAKHARASSAVVSISTHGDTLLVDVRDDGVGGADAERGSGLRGLADRVEAMGGRLHVSSPPGRGTKVTAEIPCEP